MSPLPKESVLVERLQALFATRRRDVLLGIGDDTAIVMPSGPLCLSTDVLVENQDFRTSSDPRLLGRKALNVNLSDLAAMGATPLHALVALGLPREADPAWLEAFAQGLKSAAVEHGVAVVGGDLSASPTVFIAVTVTGRPNGKPLTRSGASPGDEVFVSGTLGAAAAGLGLLEAGYRIDAEGAVRAPGGRRVAAPRGDDLARLIRHQVNPRPQLELGRALAEGGIASAAIDLSDGLARDLHRLCRASCTGASVEAALLPVDSALFKVIPRVPIDPLKAALMGGEDFGLLFAVPKRKLAAIDRLTRRFPLRRIGTMDGSRKLHLIGPDGGAPLPDAGFDHFGDA